MVAVLEKRQLKWAAFAALAVALLLAACGSETEGAPSTPTPTLASSSTPERIRWGYDPAGPTGLTDPTPQLVELPEDYRVETYASGLMLPTALAFLPDGRLLVAEQAGPVRVIEGGVLQDEPFYVAEVYKELALELGLTGMAADPDFVENGYVYLYYTTDQPMRRTVLVRVRDVEGVGTDPKEILSIDLAPTCCHIAGGLRFLPDGTLLVAVGDHQARGESQDRRSPAGSILRIERNGEAPTDNPFADGDRRVYAYGLRNPFGLTVDPDTGRIFATENGFAGQDAVIEVHGGANYGWPGSDLDVPLDEVEQPALFYHQAIGPAGIEFYSSDALPALRGALLFCQYHGDAMRLARPEDGGGLRDEGIVARGCSSDILTGPDGLIYFLDIVEGIVHRIVRE